EAQQNISKILDRLAANYRLKLVTLEGAAGKVENPIISNFPDKEIRKEVALYFVREGKLTGAEYLAANSDYGLRLYGVEDPRLYMDNVEAFRQSQPFKNEAKQYFAYLKKALDGLKDYIYNDALKVFDKLENDYFLRKIAFDEYARSLFGLIEKHNLGRINYPVFYELQKVITLETKVDFIKADQERARLITELTQAIDDKKNIAALVEKSLNFKKGIISPGAFASFLKDMAFKLKINLVSYPNFSAYADYIIKYEEVASEKLFNELKKIKNDLRNALYTNDDQKQLDTLRENLDILGKLVDLKMFSEDIAYFFAHRDEMNTDTFEKFIVPQAYKYKLTVTLPQGLSYIDVYMPAWARFYELAHLRDVAFIEKTLQQMEKENVSFAALVTGGFHTEKLSRILKAKKISYLVITPRASIEDTGTYLNIMQGNKTLLDDFVKQLQSSLQAPISFSKNALEEINASPTEITASAEARAEKLSSQVTVFAGFSVMRQIAETGSTENINWGVVKSETKNIVMADLEASLSSGQIKQDEFDQLTTTVDTALAKFGKESVSIEKSGAGNVIVNVGQNTTTVLAFNLNGKEGNKIAVLTKAEAKDFLKEGTILVQAVASSQKGTVELPVAASAKDILMKMTETLPSDAKKGIVQFLTGFGKTESVGEKSVTDLKALAAKLEGLGIPTEQVEAFIGSISIPLTTVQENAQTVTAAVINATPELRNIEAPVVKVKAQSIVSERVAAVMNGKETIAEASKTL
ncbi:MAG: hypothetical protein KKH34_09775, partial [Candidatus Omnitrophica bacterium]|nr:hypothetical protein [Candidatus Omnitrophota bacterium]